MDEVFNLVKLPLITSLLFYSFSDNKKWSTVIEPSLTSGQGKENDQNIFYSQTIRTKNNNVIKNINNLNTLAIEKSYIQYISYVNIQYHTKICRST